MTRAIMELDSPCERSSHVNHSRTCNTVSKPRFLSGRCNQYDSENMQCREPVDYSQDVAQQPLPQSWPSSPHAFHAQPESPFAECSTSQPFKNRIVQEHYPQKRDAQRVCNNSAIGPGMVPGAHDPDPLHQPGDGKENCAKQEKIDKQSEEARPETCKASVLVVGFAALGASLYGGFYRRNLNWDCLMTLIISAIPLGNRRH